MDRLSYFLTEKPVFLVGLLFAGFIFLAVLFVGVAEQGRESFQRRAVENMMITGSETATTGTRANRSQVSSDQRTTNSNRSSVVVASFSEPMVIRSVSMLNPEFECTDDGTMVRIPGMRLTANDSHRTASYRWKVDILSGLDYSTRDEWRGRIPGGETKYVVSYENTETEALYSRTFTHPHDEIRMRLRVVSPNDVTSDWYVIPASKTCR